MGKDACLRELESDPSSFSARVPFLGPASTKHLMKNLGFQVAKPDRHLKRVAVRLGTTPDALCFRIAERTKEKPAVVDLVIWRLAERRLVEPLFGHLFQSTAN